MDERIQGNLMMGLQQAKVKFASSDRFVKYQAIDHLKQLKQEAENLYSQGKITQYAFNEVTSTYNSFRREFLDNESNSNASSYQSSSSSNNKKKSWWSDGKKDSWW